MAVTINIYADSCKKKKMLEGPAPFVAISQASSPM